MLQVAVAISIVLSFLSYELLGVLAGGFIGAGYIAFYFAEPFRIVSTLVIAIVACKLVEVSQGVLIIYGRKRFMLTIIVSMVLAFLFEKSMFLFSAVNQDMRIIGYIIPGLIANDMEKQGILKTTIMLLITALIIAFVIHSGVL